MIDERRVPNYVTPLAYALMAFSQIPNFFTGASPDTNGNNPNQSAGLDSITLGQLRSLVGSGPKPKVRLASTFSMYSSIPCCNIAISV